MHCYIERQDRAQSTGEVERLIEASEIGLGTNLRPAVRLVDGRRARWKLLGFYSMSIRCLAMMPF